MSKPRKSFTTKNGLELPILDLKGKEYLLAAHRIQWFRNENPSGIIKTTMLAQQGEGLDEYAIFKAEVFVDSERGPMMVSNAHKRESRKDFPDFIEKCETSAISRALMLCGYGTQFAGDDLFEGDRLSDAPLSVVDKTTAAIVPTETLTAVTERRSSFRKNVTAVGSSKTTSDDGI